MRKFLSYLRKNPASILAFGIGIAVGLLLMLPLGVAVSDGVAQILAAVVTSIVAIGGAVLLWQIQEVDREEQIGDAIATSWIPLFVTADSFFETVIRETKKEPTPCNEIKYSVQSMAQTVKKTRKRMKRFHAILYTMPAEKVLAFIQLELQLDLFDKYQRLFTLRTQGDVLPTAAVPLLVKNALELAGELKKTRSDLSVLSPDLEDENKFTKYENMHAILDAE